MTDGGYGPGVSLQIVNVLLDPLDCVTALDGSVSTGETTQPSGVQRVRAIDLTAGAVR
jgi:hypothetical protein